MHSELSSRVTYLVVFFALLVATVLTVGISFLPLPGSWHLAAGLSIAVVKAALVVLFFMHALGSPRITWAVIVTAVAGLMIMLVLTYADYLTRGEVPRMPGH